MRRLEIFWHGFLPFCVITGTFFGDGRVCFAQGSGVALEEVIVRGIRSSMKRSIDIKRDADQIIEAITADDIGKMPDQNIAESLQRLAGVQIDRRDGEGTEVRIRGLDQNITLLNGEHFTSGMEYYQLGEWRQEFNNSLEGVPSELLGGVEVYKTPTASMNEGGIGGIINLKTRSAFELDDILVAVNVKADYGFDAKEVEPSAFLVIGKNWNDRFGAILTISSSQKIVQTDYIQSFSRENTQIRCTNAGSWDAAAMSCGAGNQSYIAPGMFYVMDTEQERERLGASLNLQWRASDAIEFGFDWFHNKIEISNVQYTIKHPMVNDGASGIDESQPYSIAGGSPGGVGILQFGTVNTPAAETNTAGEMAESEADNYALNFAFDNGGKVRVRAKLTGSQSSMKQRAGYGDSRFSEYPMRAFRGNDLVWDHDGDEIDGDGNVNPNPTPRVASPTGWSGTVVNPSPSGSSARSYTYRAGDKPNLGYLNSAWLSDPDYHTYKSHWALGSDVEQDTASLRADLEYDVDFKDLKKLAFGVRLTDENVKFNELSFLTDFSTTAGVQNQTTFNTDGTIAIASAFDLSLAPNATNAGINEQVYYDLCRNGGLASGNICDINNDGYDDNQPFGPNGFFHDAAIGLKVYDLTERLYLIGANGVATPAAAIAAFDDDLVVGETLTTGTDPIRGEYIERGLKYSLLSADGWNAGRWDNSPGYLPWQTYTNTGVLGASGDASRYVHITDFFPSGGYRNSHIVFQNGEKIVDDVEGWIQNIAPNSTGRWHKVPLESWEVAQQTTAFYGMADFEGSTVPYTLNIGLRAVKTEVEVTSYEVPDRAAQWLITTDSWNGEGVVLVSDRKVTSKDYWDILPSLNFALDTSDSTKLRFTAAKVLARPDLQDLGRGFDRNYMRVTDSSSGDYYVFTGGAGGNPELAPYRAAQADIAWEWYFGDLDFCSVGLFTKSIESFIANATNFEIGIDGSPDGGSLGGVDRPFNSAGGSVEGLELVYQQAWKNGLGIALNYTYSNSKTGLQSSSRGDIGLPGVSENVLNLMGFYENDILGARLAYTWRDEYLSPHRTVFDVIGLEEGLPEYYDSYGQWDFNLIIDITENFSFVAEAINITGEAVTSYLGYRNQPMTYGSQEPRAVIGFIYRL